MNKPEFLKAVSTEIENIKKFATKKEIGNLDFKEFDADDSDRCVYGQMIGDCFRKKAEELIRKCTLVVVANDDVEFGCTFSDLRNSINGVPTKNNLCGLMRHFSALETYLILKGAKNKMVLEYLKGEREDLKL